jgi:hypothetical protein
MSTKSENLWNELRAKVSDADQRLKDLNASAKSKSEKTKAEAKAEVTARLAVMEAKVRDGQSRIAADNEKMKAWVEERKTMTQDKVAQWKEQRNAKKLATRADNSEQYAIAAIQMAAVSIDEAEQSVVQATLDRMDADAAAPSTSVNA